MAKLTIEQALKQAAAAHKAGKKQDVGRLLKAILKVDPRHPDANHNMGVFLVSMGKLEKSLPFFKGALEANFSKAQFWYSYIDALIKLNRFSEAGALLEQAKSKGAKGDAFNNLEQVINLTKNKFVEDAKEGAQKGSEFVSSPNNVYQNILEPSKFQLQVVIDSYLEGDFKKTIHRAKNLLKKFSKSSTLNNISGAAHSALSNYDTAIIYYSRALKINPMDAMIHYNMGNVFYSKGEFDTAIGAYDKSIETNPNYFFAHRNKAQALKVRGKTDAAVASYNSALACRPEDAVHYFDIGNGFRDLGDVDAAINSYKQALQINPDYAEVYNNMGIALKSAGHLDAALDSYKQAVTIKPDYVEAHYNIGVTLAGSGNVKGAITSYKRAIDINPNYVDAHYNMSEELLRDHQLELGFAEHEWRWKRSECRISALLKTSKPLWSGEGDRTVFVWRAQGIGDEIMFASLICELYAVSSKLIVECDLRLIPLFQRSFPKDITFQSDRSLVKEAMYDFHTSMGSLARIFRNSVESFEKSEVGYLRHDKARTDILRQGLLKGSATTLVGVSWKTASHVPNSEVRNIELSDLAQVLDRPEIQLVCLQYGDVSEEISRLKEDYGIYVAQVAEIDNRNDIDGLASLIMACDKVVSTTNVTVHLAGALGADVRVLLPFFARWIWGKPKSPSTWYGSVTPYRQDKDKDWGKVLKLI